MPLERKNPETVYTPYANAYTQVIVATGSKQIHVAGTVGMDTERNLVGKDDMKKQVEGTVKNIELSLQAAGAELSDVVRINIFTTDVDRYLQKGHMALAALFGETLPVSTLVGVTRLAHPDYLVEIQATAVID